MSNMSYCRWQNTYTDLRDCAGSLEQDPDYEEGEKYPLSPDERSARESLFYLMVEMLEHVGVSVEAEDLAERLAELQ
jgi:hypothetical protein